MIVQLTNKRNIILNWKVSANLNYGFLYSYNSHYSLYSRFAAWTLRGITYCISSLRYYLVNLWDLWLVITYEQEQNIEIKWELFVFVHE